MEKSQLNEVKSNELTQWLESLVAKEVKPIRERASFLVSRSTEALNNIRKHASALSEETPSATPSETQKIDIARNFGIRITGLVDAVKNPEPISYEALSDFLSSLRRFHGELIYAGSIWIRKLDPRYKETVRKMEAGLAEIRTYGKMLEEHLDRRYMTVKKYEVLLRDAETLRMASAELGRIEDEIRKLQSERENTKSACEKLIEEKQQLEISERLMELSKLESEVDKVKSEIVNLFHPLEKPVEKLLKLPERERQKLNPTAAVNLSDYVSNPVDKLCKSKMNHLELESALDGLRTMLESNAIDLKDTRARAALKSISQIKERANLHKLKEKYIEATKAYEKAAQSDDVRALLLKHEEIESKRKSTEENLGRLDRTLSTVQARKEELSKRYGQLKQGIEKSIQEVTGQSVRISG